VGTFAELHRANAGGRSSQIKVSTRVCPELETSDDMQICFPFKFRDGRLDLLIGDTPILDYYRANDPGCTLRTVDAFEEDNYAVGISKGHATLQVIGSAVSICVRRRRIERRTTCFRPN
jgi:hypothetical protein